MKSPGKVHVLWKIPLLELQYLYKSDACVNGTVLILNCPNMISSAIIDRWPVLAT